MTTRAILEAAKQKIEQGWCQGWYFKPAEGRLMGYESELACRWCSHGALLAVGGDVEACAVFEKAIGTSLIADWNDAPERTKEDVLAAFDKAIALCDSEAA